MEERDISDPQRLFDALEAGLSQSVSTAAVLELRDSGNAIQTIVGDQPEGLYAVGSPTKVMTTVMILQMVEAGLIALDEPVNEQVTAFRLEPRSKSGQVTIRHLLSHSSGIDCADDFTDTGEGDDALQRFVDEVVAGAGLLHQPGRHWSYCNAGFSLLGRLVEIVDGCPWDDSFIDRIAAPLGLTARPSTRSADAHKVQGHRFDQELGALTAENRLMGRNGGPAGSNMLATAADLADFALALCDGKERLLSSALSSEMNQVQISAPDRQQGLGWASTFPGMVSHIGITLGHTSFMSAFPSLGRTLGLTVNGPGAAQLAGEINEELFGVTPVSLQLQSKTPSVDPAKCQGEYDRRHVSQTVEYSEGQLWVTTRYSGPIREFFPDPPVTQLTPTGGSSFVSADDGSSPITWFFKEVAESGAPHLLLAANRLHAKSM